MGYFTETYTSKNKLEHELYLSNYATNFDLKNGTGVETLQFRRMIYQKSIKTEIGKLDIGKLQTTLVDLSKLSDVVKKNCI